jgi:DNA-binding Xre family transcriptional regulator
MNKSEKSKTTKGREPEGDYLPLAEQLRTMIEASGLTINSLAVAVGIPQPVLHRFVSGEREAIRLDTADKLCEYFGVRLTKPKT